MREIKFEDISNAVFNLCREVCVSLPDDTLKMLECAREKEVSEYGKNSLDIALENAKKARENNMPACQDTGLVTVFAEVGQEVHISGNFTEAVNDGVRRAYVPFRKSVLSPLTRVNTGDNTPAVIHTSLVEGENVRLTVAPKGFGSENKSRLKMLKPSDGVEGILDFVTETVSLAGADPCPPVILGVGIGGTMEKAALMAKHALAVSKNNKNPEIAALEKEILERVNKLGIGPQGLGGRITALNVYIETFPTHIAGLPVAVNVQCHCARHGEVIL